jgi:hypothetical protein
LRIERKLDIKSLIGTIVLMIGTGALGACVTTPAASPGEAAGPAL